MSERTCVIDDCERPVLARGWCRRHYKRWQKRGTTELPVNPTPPCIIEGCDGPTGVRGSARGWCRSHYRRWLSTGSPEPAPTRSFGPVCIIDGCGRSNDTRDATAHGWCRLHYRRWLTTGTTDLPVKVKATCSVDGCTAVVRARGWCKNHWRQWKKHGDPLAVATKGRPYSEDVGYYGVHTRLRKQRGPASTYTCVECPQQALDWSYDGADPDERQSPLGPYSLNQDHYVPRCRKCHRQVDSARKVA